MTTRKDFARHPPGGKARAFRLYRAEHDPRAAALAVLSRVMSGNADSQAALDEALRSPSLAPTDKRLCTELVYGVLRRYISLNAFAGIFLSRPDKLPGEMRLTLLLALYEMACLRIPHHASVGWAVNHVRNRFGQGLSKVANGALRAMQRKLGQFADPRLIARSAASEEEGLSRFFAVPAWMVRLWLQNYGPRATRLLLDAAGRAAPAGLRLNRACPDWEQSKNTLIRLYESGHATMAATKDAVPEKSVSPLAGTAPRPEEISLAPADSGTAAAPLPAPRNDAAAFAEGGGDAFLPSGSKERESSGKRLFSVAPCALGFSGTLPWQTRTLLAEGKASRQSVASYEALEAFGPASWELPIWDCCAGRGGKTMTLLEQGIAVELASDPSEQRLNALPQEYARLGLTHPPCPETLALSVEEVVARLAGREPHRSFGTILIDAPCSGLGTLSRRPEIRFRRSPEDLNALAGLQKRILNQVWPYVKPGGSLVYLTCTLNPPENELQIADFLATHSNGELIEEFRTDFASPLNEFFYGARIKKL